MSIEINWFYILCKGAGWIKPNTSRSEYGLWCQQGVMKPPINQSQSKFLLVPPRPISAFPGKFKGLRPCGARPPHSPRSQLCLPCSDQGVFYCHNRHYLSPHNRHLGMSHESRAWSAELTDPHTHTLYVCFTGPLITFILTIVYCVISALLSNGSICQMSRIAPHVHSFWAWITPSSALFPVFACLSARHSLYCPPIAGIVSSASSDDCSSAAVSAFFWHSHARCWSFSCNALSSSSSITAMSLCNFTARLSCLVQERRALSSSHVLVAGSSPMATCSSSPITVSGQSD